MRTRTMFIVSALSIATATVAVAATGQKDGDAAAAAGLAKALAGLTPGKPMLCMPLNRDNGATTAFGPNIVYTISRSLKYVSKTAGGCEGAGHGDVLVTRQFQSEPCSGDIATTVDPISRFPTGSCTLGEFTEYRKK